MNNINSDEKLFVRSEERTVSAMNAFCSAVTLGLDAVALRSKSKGFRTFAFIVTIINVIDQGRMIFANINARNQALDVIQDEEIKAEAKERSSIKSVLDNLINENGIKYQFTGKVDI